MYRVIWRFEAEPETTMSLDALAPEEELFADFDLIGDPEPVFAPRSQELAAAGLEGAPERTAPPGAFAHAFVRSADEAEELRRRLRASARTASVEIQPPLTPPVRLSDPIPVQALVAAAGAAAAPTPDYRRMQGYLASAPAGVGAANVFSNEGGRGEKVFALDLERGWSPDHEDLQQRGINSFYGASPPPVEEHGTAVLGVVTAAANGWGVQGIAPGAYARFGSVYYDDGTGRWNVSDAIYRAASLFPPGSVILIELQGWGPNQGPNPNDPHDDQFGTVPIEWWDVDNTAIRWATGRGYYVVEAAGNGSQDLDDPVYRGRLSRDGRDSGAILVGAGASAWSPRPRSRLPFSNYGSRLDVQGWGEHVVTCGGDAEPGYDDLKPDPADPRRWYTTRFGGTSSAAAVIAGVVAVIAARRGAFGRPKLTPVQMRDLLIRTGTPQADAPGRPAAAQPIGPLPDLVGAFAAL